MSEAASCGGAEVEQLGRPKSRELGAQNYHRAAATRANSAIGSRSARTVPRPLRALVAAPRDETAPGGPTYSTRVVDRKYPLRRPRRDLRPRGGGERAARQGTIPRARRSLERSRFFLHGAESNLVTEHCLWVLAEAPLARSWATSRPAEIMFDSFGPAATPCFGSRNWVHSGDTAPAKNSYVCF